jgi:hypothetical protein
MVAYPPQPVAANVITSTNANMTASDLFFTLSLLVKLLYCQYRGAVTGMLDIRLING